MTALNKLKAWQKAHQHRLVHTVTTDPKHAQQGASQHMEPTTRTGTPLTCAALQPSKGQVNQPTTPKTFGFGNYASFTANNDQQPSKTQ